MKPPKPIPRLSAKKLKALGGKFPFSSITKPSKPIRKRPRSKSEFARIYGSKERVLFVKRLKCCCCGRIGWTENAHIENGGMGRKADYTKIIPLCGRLAPKFSCHLRLHMHGREDLELWGGINLDTEAKVCELRWRTANPKEAKDE